MKSIQTLLTAIHAPDSPISISTMRRLEILWSVNTWGPGVLIQPIGLMPRSTTKKLGTTTTEQGTTSPNLVFGWEWMH